MLDEEHNRKRFDYYKENDINIIIDDKKKYKNTPIDPKNTSVNTVDNYLNDISETSGWPLSKKGK